jgi:hypothetical protein
MKVEHEGLSAAELAVLIAGYTAKTLMYDDRSWRRIPWLVKFALKGFRRDFSAPSPEEWAALAHERA